MKQDVSRLDLLNEFYGAHLETLFPQSTLCAITGYSSAWAERKRWEGNGVPFRKLGRAIRYRKSDILCYLESCKPLRSTTDFSVKGEA
jgi:predicted DNA-binding transcriptional regulator AlpA